MWLLDDKKTLYNFSCITFFASQQLYLSITNINGFHLETSWLHGTYFEGTTDAFLEVIVSSKWEKLWSCFL